jgi:hypothetical protein
MAQGEKINFALEELLVYPRAIPFSVSIINIMDELKLTKNFYRLSECL